jgi:RimJ/RimL family protein N-acetyltransferase
VADEWQCRGIGTTLTKLLFEYAAHEGFRTIYGNVLTDNQRMLDLAQWLGLTVAEPVAGQATGLLGTDTDRGAQRTRSVFAPMLPPENWRAVNRQCFEPRGREHARAR